MMRHKPGRAIAFSLRTECIPSCQVPTCHSIDTIDRSSNSSYKHRWLLSHRLTFIKCVDRYLQVDYKGLSFCGLRVYQQVILTGEAKSCATSGMLEVWIRWTRKNRKNFHKLSLPVETRASSCLLVASKWSRAAAWSICRPFVCFNVMFWCVLNAWDCG